MQRALTSIPVLALLLAALVAAPVPSSAAPTCPDPESRESCGGRVFPEPSESNTALTYAETIEGLEALEAEFDDWLDVTTIGDSFDGFDVVMAEMTDPGSSIPLVERKVVFISQSIHGNEAGGREGGVRYLEDLLRDVDPDVKALLDRVRLVQVLPNPDGWTAGDHDQVGDGDSIGVWNRGNGNGAGASDAGGVDLNRNAPWYGFIPDGRPDPLSEPETQAVVAEVQRRLGEGQDLQAGVDIHGEVPDAAAVTMLSAGQFDLRDSMKQREHGEAVVASVTEAFSPESRRALRQEIGDTPPAILHASSEFGQEGVGGSGSGFVGDWLAQADGGRTSSLSTIELLNQGVGPGVNSLTFNAELFQIYREAVAGILRALITQAALDHDVSLSLPGTVGYVRDPATVTDPVNDEERTQMSFFDDLDAYLDEPLTALAPDEVAAAGALDELDSLIVATDVLEAEGVAAVRDFAEAGGNVVLTDAALRDVPGLRDGIGDDDVLLDLSDINQVDFEAAREDPLLAGLREIAFLLVEPATLGYDTAGGTQTPAYRIETDAWEAAGGSTVGVIAEETGVGQLDLGEGRLTIVGQLLPPPKNDLRVDYGIESYGVLDTGYLVLINALGGTLDVREVDPFDPDGPEEPAEPVISRISGQTRIETAIAASADRYGDGEAEHVVLARADAFPDALAGGPLAASLGAPLLLTGQTSVDSRVAQELSRVLGGAGTVSLVGGTAALSEAVADDVRELGYEVVRYGGDSRFSTATLIAEAIPDVGAVFVATGANFPDALTAGAAAAALDGPVVLSDDDELPPSTQDYLEGLEDDVEVYAVGGQAAVAVPDATSFVGQTRFETATFVAEQLFADAASVGIATGADFADALAGVPHIAVDRGPILLAEQDGLPAVTADHLSAHAEVIRTVYLYGGEAALGPAVVDDVVAALG